MALRLLQDGVKVRVLVRRADQAALFAGSGAEVATGNLDDPHAMAAAVRGIATVVHCAATSTDWAPRADFRISNIDGTRTLLAAAAAAGVSRFVHVSTTDVYGYPRVPCDETAPLRDVGLPYNATKVAAEHLVRQAQAAGLPVVILRPATIYGPRSAALVLPLARLLKQHRLILVDRGRAPGGFLYIDNFVDAVLAASAEPLALGAAINLRDDTCETWAGFLNDLAQRIGAPPPRASVPAVLAQAAAAVLEPTHRLLRLDGRPIATRHGVHLLSRDAAFPIDTARRLLGFRSRVAYAEGMAATADWAKAQLAAEAAA
ncbi:MAG: NAD-dependent epimerase/dehydratase family protein [Rhodospirillaceae bacterium]|nr:NAD-dependent epimerase/dehydratase family protein [Rhodospirillaceae bacterium]